MTLTRPKKNLILFVDGVLDFATGLFRPEMDPTMLFKGRIPRRYNNNTMALKAKLESMLADGDGPGLLNHLARMIAGHASKPLFILRGPSSGAYEMSRLLKDAFGEFVDVSCAMDMVQQTKVVKRYANRHMG